MKAIKTFVLAAAFLACSLLTTAYSAVDMFLELDGIKGESQDEHHPGQIEILSFSWGVSQTRGGGGGGGGGAGKVSFQDISFSTNPNRSSPAVFLACATGQHIKKATLFVRKSGGAEDYYKITLTDVLVSSFTDGGDNAPDGQLTESLSLNFSKIEFEYTTASGEKVKAGYDLKLNKKV